MEAEIEAKFLDIDPEGIRNRLGKIGAALVHPERIMRRWNFDYHDRRLEKIGGWIRIRDERDKITLSHKRVSDFHAIHGTSEITVRIDDAERMRQLLAAIGLEQKSYQETKREQWERNGVEIAIDTWPWIPTFLEIEGRNEASVRSVAEELGLVWNDALFGSVEGAYKRYFDVADEEIDGWKTITFGPVPLWLEAKRRPLLNTES